MVLVLNLQDVQLEHANCFGHCGWQPKEKNAWGFGGCVCVFQVFWVVCFVFGIWCAVAFCLFMTVLHLVSTNNSPQPLSINNLHDR